MAVSPLGGRYDLNPASLLTRKDAVFFWLLSSTRGLDVGSNDLYALVCDCIGIVVKLCFVLCTVFIGNSSGNCFTKRREINDRERALSSLSKGMRAV